MSYPHYSYVDHTYSPSPSASTPQAHTLAPAQWDTSNPPILQESNDALQHQHQQALHSPIALNPMSAPQMYQQHQHTSEHSTPIQNPAYEPPAVIQLQERPPRRTMQQRKVDREATAKTRNSVSAKPISPLTLHGVQVTANDRNDDVQSPLSLSDQGNSELASMPIRHNRSVSKGQVRFTSHPYPRSSRSSSGGEPAITPSTLLSHYPVAPYATLATCATTDSPRLSPMLSAVSAPRMAITAVPTSQPVPSPARQRSSGRYMIRTDMHYSPLAKTLTMVLELPGVKKSAVKLQLMICGGVKQLEVCGMGHRVPTDIYEDSDRGSVERGVTSDDVGEQVEKIENRGYFTLMERKFGEYRRTFIVPHDTTPDKIGSKFEDGLLIITIPCEQPMDSEAPHELIDIPIN